MISLLYAKKAKRKNSIPAKAGEFPYGTYQTFAVQMWLPFCPKLAWLGKTDSSERSESVGA
jgi:hypothetical protein